MKKFEFLDITTADVCFVAYGKDLNELFSNAALAMFETMINPNQIKPQSKKNLEVKGNDMKSLMFDWLNELLFYFGAENLAFSKFEVEIDKKTFSLKAVCSGEKIDPERHEIRTEVKATTYHKMEIEKNDIWKARVILDVWLTLTSNIAKAELAKSSFKSFPVASNAVSDVVISKNLNGILSLSCIVEV